MKRLILAVSFCLSAPFAWASARVEDNFFSGAQITAGTLPSARLDSSSVTLQGNTFNGASQLLQCDSSGLVAETDVPHTLSSSFTFQNAAFSVGGSTLTVLAGNVGIGTASPTTNLYVVGNATFTGVVNASSFNVVGSAFMVNGVTVIQSGETAGSITLQATTIQTVDSLGTVVSEMAGSTSTGSTFVSSVTVTAGGFSVGGSTFSVNAGKVGIGAAEPPDTLNIWVDNTGESTSMGLHYWYGAALSEDEEGGSRISLGMSSGTAAAAGVMPSDTNLGAIAVNSYSAFLDDYTDTTPIEFDYMGEAADGGLLAQTVISARNANGNAGVIISTGGHFTFWSDSAVSSPTISSCGTSPALAASSTDAAGKITTGSSASDTCTLTFASAYGSAPICMVVGEDSAINLGATTTATALVITAPAATDFSSDVLMYHCVGIATN